MSSHTFLVLETLNVSPEHDYYNKLLTFINLIINIMPKLAKCGIHGLSFCNNKHDAPQCDNCILVKRRPHIYKFVNGHKLKRCPHCGEYKMLNEFKRNSNGHISWCYSCHKEYARNRHHLVNKSFMIGHRVNDKKEFIKADSAVKMIKLVREYLVNNNETIVEIKRL